MVPNDIDVGDSRFHQSSRQQQRLTGTVTSVALADGCRFGLEIEGGARRRIAQQALGLAVPPPQVGRCRSLLSSRWTASRDCLSPSRSASRTVGQSGKGASPGMAPRASCTSPTTQGSLARPRKPPSCPGAAVVGTSAGPLTWIASHTKRLSRRSLRRMAPQVGKSVAAGGGFDERRGW